MKVRISVWRPDKPHKYLEGMPLDTILECELFKEPEIIGLGMLIERCKYDQYKNSLLVYLDEYPTRIDADPSFQAIHILNADIASHYLEYAYTILDADKGKGIILWSKQSVLA